MKEIFAGTFGADPAILADIGMEAKGLEFSEYMTKESLAQQGGYGLALKGPQHDEAWLIFLDMVHNFMPTFENDIIPEDNKDTKEPAKVIKHLQWYADYFSAVTGRSSAPEDLVAMSEVVYNFQRIFNLKMGFGTRAHDALPYRAMGPVTELEYESRAERYDTQLQEKYKVAIDGKTTAEKLVTMRQLREEQYEKLQDAVYERRGWTNDGIPTVATVKRLGIDFDEVLEVLKANGVQ